MPPAKVAIAKTIKVEYAAIESLKLDPKNARRYPERNLEAIKTSLLRFGQQKPIVVDAKGVVRAGNGALEAAKALGWQEIAVVRSKLKAADLKAYALADNRSSELAEWDDEALAATLTELEGEGFDLAEIGWDEAEVDSIIGAAEGETVDDPQGEWKGMPEFDNPAEAVKTIHVHFATDEDVRRFADLVKRDIEPTTKTLWFPPREKTTANLTAWESAS